MNKPNSLKRAAKILAFVLAVAGLAGVAIAWATAPQETVTLTYKFTQGASLSYKNASDQVQNVDAMGQTMTTEVNSSLDFTLKPKGLKDGNHILELTIDGMAMNTQSPQGNMAPDLSGVIGKSFDLILSPQGQEIDVSGAAAFKVDMGEAGSRDLSSDFQGLFVNLPDRPVKVGDKWPSEKAIVQKSSNGDIHIAFKNENTLDGFETVEGRLCARIKTAVRGTISGALNQGGMALALDAKTDGTETSFFAVKDGVFIKSEMVAAMNGAIAIESMGMTLSFTGQQKNTKTLVKK
jgi:hypothetical protein